MQDNFKILFVGDLIAKHGRLALSMEIDRIVDKNLIDFVIVNGENSAGGFGITVDVAKELFSLGVDVITSGNHIWDKREQIPQIFENRCILRPANYPEGTPGKGFVIKESASGVKVAVINLEGRVYMKNLDCPFRVADALIKDVSERTPIIFVDIHAEATSEKVALGWYLDGRVSAVIGTHTHVQTADERILDNGTAYLTDAGMTGSFDSVIGIGKEEAIKKFLTQLPVKFENPKKNLRVNAVIVTVDRKTGKATNIERINIQAN